MKTLREYIDQLDEISRRDALKYAGATAAGAALGGAAGFYKGAEGQVDKNTAYDYGMLSGFTQQIITRMHDYQKVSEPLDNIYYQLLDLDRRIPSDKVKNDGWFEYAYNIGKRNFDRMFPQGLQTESDIAKFVSVSNTLLERLKESSYGYGPKKESKELEETAEEDSIAKIDRLFRD